MSKTFAMQHKAKSRSANPAVRAGRPAIPTWKAHQPAVRQILNGPALQTKLTIGAPNDKYEQEADRVAEQVMRMPEPQAFESAAITGSASPAGIQRVCQECEEELTDSPLTIQRMCPECEEELQRQPADEDEEERIQAKKVPGRTPQVTPEVQARINGLRGNGQPLPASARGFFEPRFGQDFGGVRVHTGARAAEAAGAVKARAFTMGRDVVFGEGTYAPGSPTGQQLLAHELTHVVQQTSSATTWFATDRPAIQREIVVDDTVPTDENEPARGLSQSDFRARVFPQADTLIQGLCGQFRVNSGTGVVEPRTRHFCDNLDTVANRSSRALGCCCLCIMIGTGTHRWSLIITEFEGPHTELPPSRKIFVHPASSDFSFGHWAVPDAVTGIEHMPTINNVAILGHELCGHAALMELGAHAADADRVRTNVHDSTVRVQNAIAHEQGVSVTDDRALAGQGTHRGESTIIVTLSNFRFNRTTMPERERNVLRRVASFALANRLWIDILGHSDTVGSPAAKLSISQQRADTVKNYLVNKGLSERFNRRGLTNVKRYTRVEGRSDFDLLPGSVLGVRDPRLRRVEIFMTSRPAGAQRPVLGTPTTQTDVGPENQGTVNSLLAYGDACEEKLVGAAWPPGSPGRRRSGP